MDYKEKLLLSLLNLSESDIDNIYSVNDGDKISIYLSLSKKALSCPICSSSDCHSHGFYKRIISVPNRAFDDISVHLNVRRYLCNNRHSFSETFNMSPANSRVSYDSIVLIMKLLSDLKITFKMAARMTHLSESTIIRIFDKHCHITRSSFPDVVCIDEVFTKNSDFESKFSCIFYDFYRHKIIDVAPSRKKNYLHHYFQSIPNGELLNVKYVCIDMYLPYKQISKIYFKKAIICVDSFHVIKHLNDSFSKIKIKLMKSFSTDSIEYYLLKQWKNLLFHQSINLDNDGKFNKRLNRVVNYRQILDMILDIDPTLKKAYELKEEYIDFNAHSTYEKAKVKLDCIIDDFINDNIPLFDEFVTSLVNWKEEIINSFILYKGKRINSSIAESMNAIVSDLIYNTIGIRNHERRRKRIMFVVNKEGFSLK